MYVVRARMYVCMCMGYVCTGCGVQQVGRYGAVSIVRCSVMYRGPKVNLDGKGAKVGGFGVF